MKPFLLISLLLLSNFSLLAQRFSVENFRTDPSDISAISNELKDVYQNKCAIIKVRSNMEELSFDSNLGITEVLIKNSEYWIYVSPQETLIKFMKEGYITLDYNLPQNIETSTVYILELLSIEPASKEIPVTIRVIPSDATIFINEKEVSNIAPHQLLMGTNTIRIEKIGFQTIEKDININEQQVFFEFNLERQPDALLEISSEPSGASTYINGVLLGETPVSVFFKPGNYSLRLVKNGLGSVEEPIEVILPDTKKLYKLIENAGFVTINTYEEAKVYINGNLYSNTKDIKLLPQVLRIRVSMPMAEDLTEQIVLKSNDNLVLDMYPVKKVASMQLLITPFEADVILKGEGGGEFTSKGSKEFFDIPARNYSLTVTAPGFESYQENFTLQTEEFLVKKINLKQVNDTTSKHWSNKFDIGVEVGPSLNSIYQFESNGLFFHVHRPINFLYGPFLQFNFNKFISLRTNIAFESQKVDIIQNDTHDTTPNINFHWLTLPVLFRATFGKKVQFFINSGLYFSYLFEKTLLNKKTLGFEGGLGLSVPIKQKFALSLEINSSLIFKPDPDFPYFGRNGLATNIRCGFTYKLGQRSY